MRFDFIWHRPLFFCSIESDLRVSARFCLSPFQHSCSLLAHGGGVAHQVRHIQAEMEGEERAWSSNSVTTQDI